MAVKLNEIADVAHLQSLCSSFSDLYGVTTAILDLKGEVLVAAGWKVACTKFHRVNPVTAARCLESDTTLASHLKAGQEYNVYCCKNGLVDVAVPIKVQGHHIANFFTGQFFFETPDRKRFRRQAGEVGFDEALYLHAIDDMPVFSEEKVKLMMAFLRQLAELIGELGQANLLLKAQKDAVEKLALYDPLTNLPNRNYLCARLDKEIAKSKRSQQPFACLFIDLDNFKNVNDSLGHEAGDQVLVEAGRRIRKAVREYDLVARFGGDEFIVVAAELSYKEVAGKIAEKIILALNEPFAIDNQLFNLSASVGIAVFPGENLTSSDLLRAADTAMYRSKYAGKGCFHYFSGEPASTVLNARI
ncbi:diguanylate cyclase domain-containing protein [Pontibacter sp. JAM-7]|uniref:diguanylate cyclase domain-containing protein n=1 Tax=Pontibacter sp. JAM-7 TaxID=3366581 RepID=UPI003AF90949